MRKSREEKMAELIVSYIDSLKENIEELEKENKLLEQAINELMVQCDIKYFRFMDKEFYKQESNFNFSSKKK
jgi:hypothetical protein